MRLIASSRSQSSSVRSWAAPVIVMPALFTTTSTPPNASIAACTPAATSALRVTSIVHAVASPPAARISAAVSSAVSPRRSATATRAPSSAKRSDVCRPIPDPPPVTSATFPSSLPISPPRRLP